MVQVVPRARAVRLVRVADVVGYARLVESRTNNAGQFADPISTPGAWKDNIAFRYVHTQDPSGAAGMDDRYDLVLLGKGLTDGKRFEALTFARNQSVRTHCASSSARLDAPKWR